MCRLSFSRMRDSGSWRSALGKRPTLSWNSCDKLNYFASQSRINETCSVTSDGMARQERHQPSGCIMSLMEMPWVQTRRVSLRWQTGGERVQIRPGKLEVFDQTWVATTGEGGRDGYGAGSSETLVDSRGCTGWLIYGYSGRVYCDSGPSLN